MKKNFSDYPVYAIPDEIITDNITTDSGIKIIVFRTSVLSELEKVKLEQIVGAIDIDPSEVYYKVSSKHQSHEQMLNTLMNKKVSCGISFSSENPRGHLFQMIKQGEYGIILSCAISDLIKDEEEAITTRRKALWMAMKKWK